MEKTFRQFAIEYMTSNGMFEQHAKEVFGEIQNDPANDPMIGRWNDSVSEYPDIMQNVLAASVKRCAKEWIEKNMPMAWYRPMFD